MIKLINWMLKIKYFFCKILVSTKDAMVNSFEDDFERKFFECYDANEAKIKEYAAIYLAPKVDSEFKVRLPSSYSERFPRDDDERNINEEVIRREDRFRKRKGK